MQALEGYRKCRSPSHSSTLTVLHNWSLVRWRRGDPAAALSLLRDELLPAAPAAAAAAAVAAQSPAGQAAVAAGATAAGVELERAVSLMAAGSADADAWVGGQAALAYAALERHLSANSVANIIVVKP